MLWFFISAVHRLGQSQCLHHRASHGYHSCFSEGDKRSTRLSQWINHLRGRYSLIYNARVFSDLAERKQMKMKSSASCRPCLYHSNTPDTFLCTTAPFSPRICPSAANLAGLQLNALKYCSIIPGTQEWLSFIFLLHSSPGWARADVCSPHFCYISLCLPTSTATSNHSEKFNLDKTSRIPSKQEIFEDEPKYSTAKEKLQPSHRMVWTKRDL